jgi:L-fuconolactonase
MSLNARMSTRETSPLETARLSRREFVRLGATLAAAPGLAVSLTTPLDSAMSGIVDCHTHFYDPTRPQGVPWPPRDDKLLYRRVLPEHYKTLARPHGVSGTVVVEASAWRDDNQWVLDLAASEPFLVGLVGRLEPGAPGFAKHLRRLAGSPRFRGIRLWTDQHARDLEDARFLADLKRLADLDLAVDVNGGATLLADTAKLAERLPRLRLVINHLANLRIDGQSPPRAWLEGMQAAARHPAVFCKVSGLVEGTGRTDGRAPADVEFYRPALDAVWQCFGENRLLYGSNWPVSERFASYATVQKIVGDYFQSKGRAVADKFFRANSVQAYRWRTG